MKRFVACTILQSLHRQQLRLWDTNKNISVFPTLVIWLVVLTILKHMNLSMGIIIPIFEMEHKKSLKAPTSHCDHLFHPRKVPVIDRGGTGRFFGMDIDCFGTSKFHIENDLPIYQEHTFF